MRENYRDQVRRSEARVVTYRGATTPNNLSSHNSGTALCMERDIKERIETPNVILHQSIVAVRKI